MLAGTILSKARLIETKRIMPKYKGIPVIAIDADGETYHFDSCTQVELECRISAARIQKAMTEYKSGKREAPLVEGFCWLKEQDKDQWLHKIKAWIVLNAKPNPNTHI